ncbi:retrovirus-related pol polyprotein from transposon TNT 1-94 [Tanacetum coccineum]|uniref:Retrovirus-related pol polyprotein from transposon TNT 1-94 n=1 Tax=Tanacetum coccineum TaxID=301880 RepID=A0ABQ4X042_9ASTR
MASVSKSISIPNEEFLDDTSPSNAQKFLNEVKSTIVALQCVVKQKMTLDIHNWSSSANQELLKIVKDEIYPIVNQVDARVQNFKIQFLKEAAKFVRDFKSLANEADESLAKHKALEFKIERLLRAVENEYAKLWNDWYKECEECEYDKISYDKAYNDMQQKIEQLQAQLGDQKGKNKDTPCVLDTLDPLSQKLENKNLELEFQVLNYAKENAHLKTTYKNLFDSINVTRTKTKTIIDSLQEKLHNTIYENAKLRAQLFVKVSKQKDTTKGTSVNTKFTKQSLLGKPPSSSKLKLYSVTPFPNSKVISKVGESNAMSDPVTLNAEPFARESKVVKNDNVITPGMFRINPSKTSRVDNDMPNKTVKASIRTKPITTSQPHVSSQENVNSNSNGISSTGVESTAKTRIPQPRSNTKNDRVPSASKSSCIKNKEVEVEEHHKNLLLFKNKKHMSSECNLFVLCVIQICLWCIDLGCSKHMTGNLKLLIYFVWKLLGNVRFRNDHVAAILGYGDLQWGNIFITRVYFVKGLRHNLFSVGQFCDSDLEVAFRMNTCFVRNLEGVDLLNGNRTTNLYTINLHDIAYASLICLMACATSTKSWLWHQRLSHLNSDTINDLAKNDLFSSLLKFKYHKEHLCPSFESINRKRYMLVIVDDYSRYTWVHFLRSKDEVLLKAPVIINDREDIGKLGEKGDIGFFVGYSANSYAYKVYNRRTKKIMEMMNVTFDELSAMDFEQRSSKHRLQSMNSGQIRSGLDLTYAPSTITTHKPTEPAPRTAPATLAPQVLQTPTTSTTTADTAPTPTNSFSQATIISNTSQDVDELEPQQQHVQQQDNQAPLQPETVVDNVPNVMFNGDVFENPFVPPSTSAGESSSSLYVAMTDPTWIDSMQEELLQLKRLDVWVLVPAPDNIKPLTLKWLFKNKHDEENTVLETKYSSSCEEGYRQKREGIDFEGILRPD